MDNKLWLFDYNQGISYEAFSSCEDSKNDIFNYLNSNFFLKNKTILEVGAGSGKFTSFLANKSSNLIVVEKSEALMQINYAKNNKASNIKFIRSDIKDVVIDDQSVDIIFLGWSLTSMRDIFSIIFRKFERFLKPEGKIILVENAGDDEFSKIVGIEDFTKNITKSYISYGFTQKQIIKTIINLPNKETFYNAFPGKRNVPLPSLQIQHNVLILEMDKNTLTKLNTKG